MEDERRCATGCPRTKAIRARPSIGTAMLPARYAIPSAIARTSACRMASMRAGSATFRPSFSVT
jgi:hypothetical protein